MPRPTAFLPEYCVAAADGDVGTGAIDDVGKSSTDVTCMRACVRARCAYMDFYVRLCEEAYRMAAEA